MTALAFMVSDSEVIVKDLSGFCFKVVAVWLRKNLGLEGLACVNKLSIKSFPLMEENPPTSKMAFSGYMAVICPPGSSKLSIKPTLMPRKPA